MNTPKKRVLAALLSSLVLVAALVLWNRPPTHRAPASTPASALTASDSSTTSTPLASDSSTLITSSSPAPSLADTTGLPAEFARFNDWLSRYLTASPADRTALLVEGRAHAATRRAVLARLITTDPRRALALAVPMVARQQLPADILALLEERVSTRGSLGVLGAVGIAPDFPALRRIVQIENGPRYNAYVFGRRSSQVTTPSIHVSGIAIDRALALDERPLRILEAGEIPDASKPRVETCLVSGKIADALAASNNTQLPAITEETPAVEIAGTIQYVCSGGHIQIIEDRLVAGEGMSGGAVKPTTAITSTQSTGVRSLLYMRVTFPDSNRDPQTETAAYDMMRQVNDWFIENSYGNLYLVTTVAPLIVLPRSEAWYTSGGGDEYDLRSDAQEVARRLGYDTNQYDLDIVTYTGGPGGFGGLGYVGGKGSWIKSISVGVICHELGHNFGVWHANFWNTSGASIIGTGSNTEYGNPFDTMGSASAGDLQFNANHKNILNWLPTAPFVQTVTTSGTYRIAAYDQSSLNPANRYALKIVKDSDRDYWAEFRQRSLSSNRWTKDGILLNWSAWYSSENGAQLLDTTPGSPDDRTDAALTVGRTFSDFEAGIHLTPLGKVGTAPESMDVVVNLGTFPGNQEPTLALSTSAITAAPNTSITLTATASDSDGDALSYAWDFGDKTFHPANAAIVTKSWSTAGDYVVRCVVSDMKGKTASRSTIVRVGSPTTLRVSGQITLAGQPLANVRVHNGLTGANYRGSYTNTDGTYTISGLAAGSYTFAAALNGYTFAASGFANPLTVSADFSSAHFAATATPTVSLAVTDTDCTEGTNTGRFTLTRTGATTSALTVRFFYPTGTAPKGSDYTLSPDLVSASPGYTATIPAGASSLDLVVTATDDATAEGPEIATLELAPGSGYTISGPAIATLIIQDNDTTKPVVSIRTTDAFATEAADSASVLISRTGDTSSALTVAFTLAGAASPAIDYTAVGTSLTIPAGASSATLTFSPINDSSVEGTETVTVALAANAAYIIAPGSTTQTLSLLDDDIPTITVTALDSAASEVGPDNGIFLLSRTGDTSLPLTINYALSGSAAQGVDYLPVPGVLTLAAGASSGTVTIEPVDDSLGEPSQTVVLQIRSSTAYVSGSPSLATVTIADNNDAPVVTVGIADGAVSEPSDTGRFRITTTGTGTGNITVRYTITGTATNGTDFTALPGTLSIGRNTTSDITVTPIDDALLENIETITLSLTPDPAYSTHLDTQATMSLVDNDQACVNVTADNIAFSETSTGRFYISRTGATTAALTVAYTLSGSATNGTDYNALSGSVTIAAGSVGASIDLVPINDTLAEGSETALITLSPGAYGLGLASATLILTDNEVPAVQVRFAASTSTVAETAGALALSVTLSAPAPSGGVTVDYLLGGGTALGQIDYLFTPGVLTFASGETAKTIPLAILDDTAIEPSQTVILKLANPTGASLGTSTMTVTITDNDPAVASVSPIEQWRSLKFGGSASNSSIAGDLADPDADGLVNILEYATGADPLLPSTPPQAGFAAGQLTLTYDRSLTATDILYTIEEVSLLTGTWTQVTPSDETLSDNGVIRKIKSKVTASGPSKFLRLRVTR
ncbi:hypothetical protein CMV30_10265 [Nibricoccus aquaticus]|uniref:PKD domain-containing protein n=1 Tax=Nibricoccus aquaticus TaxID=2576891 RepID=A0A290QDH8_9BACT|nr:Calx-beta domain-containing protein [Nibricoccus aquaticus]ATC64306.1 hypothetical protein CMV30_10265 [Nibricoccus aquaticus]